MSQDTKCIQCGGQFTCGTATGDCWCMRLPHQFTVPAAGAGCFCPKCLALQGQALQGQEKKIDQPIEVRQPFR